jgi:hypothetical protein
MCVLRKKTGSQPGWDTGLLDGMHVGFSRHVILSLTFSNVRQAVQVARLFSETVSSPARKASMSPLTEVYLP